MKANPNANVLRLFSAHGLHMDASSGFEVERAIAASVPPHHIRCCTPTVSTAPTA